MENGRFTCLSPPPLGWLATTYDVHLRLIGKCVVSLDFLLVLIELFSLGVTASALRAFSLQRGQFDPKFQVTNYSSCHKTMVSDLSRSIRMWAQLSFILSQIMRLADGQTDKRTDSFLVARPRCMQCT